MKENQCSLEPITWWHLSWTCIFVDARSDLPCPVNASSYRHPAFVNVTVSRWNKCCRSNLEPHFSAKWKQYDICSEEDIAMYCYGCFESPKTESFSDCWESLHSIKAFSLSPSAHSSAVNRQVWTAGWEGAQPDRWPELTRDIPWSAMDSNTK